MSQNLKKIGKHIPGLPHFRVCPPHFLERIVALVPHRDIVVSFLFNLETRNLGALLLSKCFIQTYDKLSNIRYFQVQMKRKLN